MKTAVIVFIIFATVFAIGTLIYVVVDIILSIVNRKEKEVAPQTVTVVVPVPEPEPEPEPEPIPVPVVIPEVEKIDAIEADELITDEVAMSVAEVEEGKAGVGFRAYINIGVINDHFEPGDEVTLAAIKEKKLLPKKVQRIKVLADGVLDRPLKVKAESFSIQAIKMIELTGGTVVILK